MRILIIDDHPLFCEGLKLLLLSLGEKHDIGICTSRQQLDNLPSQTAWDMVLLDWNLGGMGVAATDLIERLSTTPESPRVVVVSAEVTPARVKAAIDAGAVGFVPKEASSDLLIDAIRITSRGGIYLPAGAFASSTGKEQAQPPTTTPRLESLENLHAAFPRLTSRQLDVLVAVVRGQSNKRVARELDISDNTVKQHLHAVYRELDVSSRTEAIYLLAKRGIQVF